MENFEKESKPEILEDWHGSGTSNRLEGDRQRPPGDCSDLFYVSAWVGDRIQLYIHLNIGTKSIFFSCD